MTFYIRVCIEMVLRYHLFGFFFWHLIVLNGCNRLLMNVGILVGLLVSSYILQDMTANNSIGLEEEESQNKFKRNQREWVVVQWLWKLNQVWEAEVHSSCSIFEVNGFTTNYVQIIQIFNEVHIKLTIWNTMQCQCSNCILNMQLSLVANLIYNSIHNEEGMKISVVVPFEGMAMVSTITIDYVQINCITESLRYNP